MPFQSLLSCVGLLGHGQAENMIVAQSQLQLAAAQQNAVGSYFGQSIQLAQQHAYTYEEGQSGYRPVQQSLAGAHLFNIILGLINLNIPEIILSDSQFQELMQYCGITETKVTIIGGEYGGIITVRNQKYVLSLDDYLEDVPRASLP